MSNNSDDLRNSDSRNAYAEAAARIRRAADENAPTLRLSDLANLERLPPLGSLLSLRELDLAGTKIDDLSSVSVLSDLRALDVHDTGVTDLTPLNSLGRLQTLNIEGTSVSDLSPLEGLRSLEALNLSRTQVRDLLPLASLPSLERGARSDPTFGGLIFSNSNINDPVVRDMANEPNPGRTVKILDYVRRQLSSIGAVTPPEYREAGPHISFDLVDGLIQVTREGRRTPLEDDVVAQLHTAVKVKAERLARLAEDHRFHNQPWLSSLEVHCRQFQRLADYNVDDIERFGALFWSELRTLDTLVRVYDEYGDRREMAHRLDDDLKWRLLDLIQTADVFIREFPRVRRLSQSEIALDARDQVTDYLRGRQSTSQDRRMSKLRARTRYAADINVWSRALVYISYVIDRGTVIVRRTIHALVVFLEQHSISISRNSRSEGDATLDVNDLVERRLNYLKSEAKDENELLNSDSERDLRRFLEGHRVKKPNLYLIDNGNFRAQWKGGGRQLGLQFLGGGEVQFVVFARRPDSDRVVRSAGRDSLAGIDRQISAFDLRELVFQ
jgi:hypothetical protein